MPREPRARVALRVIAVKQALDGTDFIDIFKFFLESGQPEDESVRSAQRIFRGGDVKGGVTFTKDAVYLQGLVEVHTFLRVATRDNRPELIRNLFAGRLTMADVLRLAPHFETGWPSPPAYLPVWASDLRRLAAMMAYSTFVSAIKLKKVYLERIIELEEELKTVLGIRQRHGVSIADTKKRPSLGRSFFYGCPQLYNHFTNTAGAGAFLFALGLSAKYL